MLLSKMEGTTPRLLDITTIPELGKIGRLSGFCCLFSLYHFQTDLYRLNILLFSSKPFVHLTANVFLDFINLKIISIT